MTALKLPEGADAAVLAPRLSAKEAKASKGRVNKEKKRGAPLLLLVDPPL